MTEVLKELLNNETNLCNKQLAGTETRQKSLATIGQHVQWLPLATARQDFTPTWHVYIANVFLPKQGLNPLAFVSVPSCDGDYYI